MERRKSKIIRDFILNNIEAHPSDISALTGEEFGISRQAVSKHLKNLIAAGDMEASGMGRNRKYELRVKASFSQSFDLETQLEEGKVWSEYVKPFIGSHVGKNVYDILYYGFSEIFNNAIDHSEGKTVELTIGLYANKIWMHITDDGIGIFKKIQDYFKLENPMHALLELAKGKLTSDPEKHTGEGIFFTSRMFDQFMMWSHFLSYIRHRDDDWLFEDRDKGWQGTNVSMQINLNTNTSVKEIFDKYADEAREYGFTKTHVPVNMALYEGENLVSRSQAKRLLARVDKFREVWLDFKGVKDIGPAFSDEIFRVFANAHPDIKLRWNNADPSVEKMIRRALTAAREQAAS